MPAARKPKTSSPTRALGPAKLGPHGDSGNWVSKLHPEKFSSMSPKMAAFVGHITDQRYTNPHIAELETTSDGMVLARPHNGAGHEMFGHISDVHQNWGALLDAADLSPQERARANSAFARKLKISVTPMRRGIPEGAVSRADRMILERLVCG